MTSTTRPNRLRPRKTPRQVRAEETRARLLDAAAEVFETHGYDAGTTNAIAAAASMSVGSLYQYFPNKDAILVELMVRHIADGADRVRAAFVGWARSGTGLDGLVVETVRSLLALHRESPVLHQVLMTQVPLPRDVAQQIEALEVEVVAELIGLLRAFPAVPADEVDRRAVVVATTVNSLVHTQVARPTPLLDDDTFVTETASMVTAYLTRP